jgi:ComF family protein
MIDRLLSYIAPHLCLGCAKVGSLLCESCKYNISEDAFSQCIVCGSVTGDTGICQTCTVPYQRAWCVGERSGVLQRLIGNYKFQNVYGAYQPLADLLDECISGLPDDTIIVPMPTTSGHIRERGYDHMQLIAQRIASRRGLLLVRALRRITNTKQRGVGRAARARQAKAAFKAVGQLDSHRPYLLIDDVVTTGATMFYAAQALRDAGATTVWIAAIARQPLD